MFLNRDEYDNALENLSRDLKVIYDRTSILKMPIQDFLENYKIRKVDSDFLSKDVIESEFQNNSKVSVSLSSALAGNLGNLGKTYGDLYQESIEESKNYSSIELETTTGLKVEFIIFKGLDLKLEFNEDGLLKVYGLIVRMDKNPSLVDVLNKMGRTLNLFVDIPTFVYAPSNGTIHGIANYSKVLELANDGDDDTLESKIRNSSSDSNLPDNAVFVIYNNAERFIPRQEGNIIDWEFYNGIRKLGYDYNDILLKDLRADNIKFPKNSPLEEIRESYKQPLMNYVYQNRENCSLTSFYALNQNVNTLRLDITSNHSVTSFKGLDSFTSRHDYGKVNRVFVVIPNEKDEFQYDIECMVNEHLSYMGFQDSKRYVFIQARNSEDFIHRKAYLGCSYEMIDLGEEYCEYKANYANWDFRAFLVGPNFKFVDEVTKLN